MELSKTLKKEALASTVTMPVPEIMLYSRPEWSQSIYIYILRDSKY